MAHGYVYSVMRVPGSIKYLDGIDVAKYSHSKYMLYTLISPTKLYRYQRRILG